MIDLQAYLEKKLKGIISDWTEEDIYAISFFVYANEAYEYNGYSNVTQFSVSYNTEKDCGSSGELSEERWNYAFWRQNEIPIIEADNGNEGIKILFDWYEENDVNNIGYENYNACYDNEMRYIGKGPSGYYELLSEITAVAKSYKIVVLLRINSADQSLLLFTIWNIHGMLSKQPKKPIQMVKPICFLLR